MWLSVFDIAWLIVNSTCLSTISVRILAGDISGKTLKIIIIKGQKPDNIRETETIHVYHYVGVFIGYFEATKR